MCVIGTRLRVPHGSGAVYGDGTEVAPGTIGTVIGHVANSAIVTTDERTDESILVPDHLVRPISRGGPRPVAVMPSGKVHRLTRHWPRARTRK